MPRIAATVLVALIFAACSGGNDGAQRPTSAPATPPPTASPAAAAAPTPFPTIPAATPALGGCPLDYVQFCARALRIDAALNEGDTATIISYTDPQRRLCRNTFWATDDDIGCSDPIVQGESSHPVVLLLFSGGDCCAMTPPFFESEFTSWIAESRGGPRWRAYAVVTGSPLWEGDDAVIFVTGTESDSRFIEIALSDEEGPFIQGMIIGTFATGPYVFPPEQLLPWR